MRTLVLLTLLAANGASAQIVHRISGRAGDANHVEDVAPLPSLDLVMAGDMVNFQDGIQSIATLTRVAPDGTPIWTKGFDFPGVYDTGVGVRALSGGDIAFLFYTGTGNDAVTITRTDGAGQPLWTKRYPGDYSYPPGGLKIANAEQETIAFANRYSTQDASGGQLLRVSAADGSVQVNNQYTGDVENVFSVFFADVVIGPGGDCFVTGGIYHYVPATDQFKTDLLVARITSAGAVVWSKLYDRVEGEFDQPDEGRGIALTQDGNVAVVGRTSPPEGSFGYNAAEQLLLDPANGDLLAWSFLDDVDVAPASLETTSSGNLLASGTRRYGDGEGAAQMWLIDPLDMHTIWRAEYGNGVSNGSDAIEAPLAAPRADGNYVLIGHRYGSSGMSIGAPDQMFVRTDLYGDDHCTARVWKPEPNPIEMKEAVVELFTTAIAGVQSYEGIAFDYPLETRLLCSGVPCPCDLNGDGFVDDADFIIFVQAYNTLDCSDPAMPPGCPSDFNGDGLVDDADFVIFVPAYNALVCP